MGGQREHVHRQLRQVDRHMSHRLHGIGVKQHTLFTADCSDLCNGFDRANFIVGKHHTDQTGVRTNCRLHRFRCNHTGFRNRQQRHGKALLLQLLQGVKNGVVLDRGGNEVLLTGPGTGIGGRPQCLIVGFAAAGGEVDLSLRTAQTAGNVLPCLQQGFCGSLPYMVQTGGVAVVLFQTGQHGTHCRFRGLCGSCIICVYLQWGFLRFLRTKSGDCRWFPALPAFLLITSFLSRNCCWFFT